jgi:ketosteroid isomerase-like protein
MSQTNKELAAAFFTALSKGDTATLRHLLHPELEAFAMGTSVLSGKRNFQQILEAVSIISQVTMGGLAFNIVSMTAEENRVSVEIDGRSTLKNGTPYNNQYHFLITIQDGKVIRLKEYFCSKMADAVFSPMFAELAAK